MDVIIGIAGSLRRDSFNRRLLRVAATLAPPGMSIDLYEDLRSIPLFNEDLEAEGAPGSVAQLRDTVAHAGGLLIATPEYNQSLPGVVKNLVDWLSRGEPAVLEGKPVGILGASPGNWGTRLAQAALRQTLTACGAWVMPTPQVYLRDASRLFDMEGHLTDPAAMKSLASFIRAFEQWIRSVGDLGRARP
jgi:chromate reductase